MNKLYDRIDFHNGTEPALNESNLNAMSKGIDDIDDRVVKLGTAVLETVPELERIAEDIEGNLDEIKEAGAKALIAEGFSVGQQNGEDVDLDSPYYHNNAKYYSELSNPTALANLSDVDVSGASAGKVLKYNGSKWEAGEGGGGGTGSGDMLQADYDADSAVKNAGGIKSFVDANADKAIILTKADYDALPESKLTDNKKYYIKDWSQSEKFVGETYSTEEIIIGEWMGKTLYRKVVEEPFEIYSSAHPVSIGVTNYNPINYQAFRVAPDGTLIKAFNQQSNSGYWLSVEKFASDGIYYRSAGWNSGTFRAIVEYTKN